MRRLIGLAGLLVLLTSSVAMAAAPEVVLNQRRVDETRSSVSDGYLVWSANTAAKPQRYNSYVRPDGGSRSRINPVGTRSYSATIDGTTIVYEEADRRDSDLYFTDAATPDRQPPPAGVNTRALEYRPSLSGDLLLFTRSNINRVRPRNAWTRIVLFDLGTDTATILRERSSRAFYLVSDQVNGDWATFESCRFRDFQFRDCQVFLYRISTQELTRLPNPDQQQYAGAVSSDGTVYLVRTGGRRFWRCGRHAKIVRVPLAGPEDVIARLPDGKDALTTFAFDERGGSTTLYLDRVSCDSQRGGIFRIVDADTTT
jgi:hypothetical protein